MDNENDIDALYATYKSLLPMAEADSTRLWQKFRLDWNYNSNRIEGSTLTYGETEALLILGTEPKRLKKDIREMKAHDLAILHVQALSKDERIVSEKDMRDLNQIALKENYFIQTETANGDITRKEIVPGRYKTSPNHVRLRGGGLHKFAEPHDVPMRLEATVKRLKSYLEKQDKPLYEYLAELHQDFIQTHPFDDGNGRVVRMLLNYVCLKLGWPPVIIKDKNKSDYLAALEQWDNGDKTALESIMKTEQIWSLNKSISAAKGESIADSDDLDKEIEMFVRENSGSSGSSIRNHTTIGQTYDNYVLPIMEKLEVRIGKFEPLFSMFHVTLKSPNLRSAVAVQSFLEKQKHAFGYNLEGFKSDRYGYNINTHMFLSFGHDSYEIKITIRSHNSRKTQDIVFPIKKYDASFDSKVVEKYTNEIIQALFEIVKDYKSKKA